ncbi:methyltransferase domain-containing protein [Streptomyces kaniharaensis]|uniref:Methyltransferase domain-containing protein n=1 Tax=Streptomyces kaniharaensis TaxID=212423 RepID=A0A6N7KUS4_9ACTN|nr:methyltransferase domain-containing protein [Streptomyces kaniharaensis]MQS13734.1 methyltransferase domain-containing protein [Streptomyces kaniharaensis]
MTTPVWDPAQYLRFADERTRPLRDLLARVPALPHEPAATILDIGCGPGNSTAVLRERWQQARITGIDNSAPMLATARAEGEPTADYLLADARDYDPAPAQPDLIVSNATLQWVDGHIELIPRWAAALGPGGAVAFQVPGNFGSPSHTLLAELRRSPRWRDALGDDTTRAGVHEPGRYLDALVGAGCSPDVWETTYSTLLPGPDPVLEWVKGTALRPVLTWLTDPAQRAAFLAEYGTLLREAYPAGPHGTVFPFRRIFAVGVKR